MKICAKKCNSSTFLVCPPNDMRPKVGAIMIIFEMSHTLSYTVIWNFYWKYKVLSSYHHYHIKLYSNIIHQNKKLCKHPCQMNLSTTGAVSLIVWNLTTANQAVHLWFAYYITSLYPFTSWCNMFNFTPSIGVTCQIWSLAGINCAKIISKCNYVKRHPCLRETLMP